MTAAGNLLGAIQVAMEAQTTATGALAQVDGALQAAQAAFAQSGGNDKIALLGAIAEKYRLAIAAGEEARTALLEMMRLGGIVSDGQVGLVPTAGGGTLIHPAARPLDRGPPNPGTPPADPLTPAEARRQFFDSALTEDKVRDILSRLPAKESRDGSPTRGVWVDEDGNERPVESGDHDLAYEAAHQYWRTVCDEVMPEAPARAWEGIRTSRHAEIKAIVEMFVKNRKHGSVVINNPDGPCEGFFGCRTLMEKYLRKSQTFTVFWPGGSMIVEGKS